MKPLAALLLLAATPAVAAPHRVASLNLCSDELALMLAAPGQLVSISRLGADPNETALAPRAAGIATNGGRVTDVVALAPDLVLASRGNPGAAAVARRLGLPVLELPQPQDFAGMRANIRAVARALGRQASGERLVSAMDRALAGAPARRASALMVGGGGVTIAADGLAAAWLAAAGLAQQAVPRGSINLEQILKQPPQYIVISNYRSAQISSNQRWLQHPALAALPASTRRLTTDGRAWTCLGPALVPEILRLRALVARP